MHISLETFLLKIHIKQNILDIGKIKLEDEYSPYQFEQYHTF